MFSSNNQFQLVFIGATLPLEEMRRSQKFLKLSSDLLQFYKNLTHLPYKCFAGTANVLSNLRTMFPS